MDFNRYLQEEIRADYRVTQKRKLLWKKEIDMLEIVKNICNKHDLEYFLLAGSALGAVRHNGFIPWDDDLDIAMHRNDLEKFVSIAEKEMQSPYFIQYGLNDGGHVCGLLRIRNEQTTGIIRGDENKNCNNGVFIEIYPFDNVSDNVFVRKLQYKLSHLFYHGLLADYYGPASCAQVFGKALIKILGKERAYKWWQNICKLCNNKETKYVDTIALPRYAREGIHYYKREWIFENVEHSFEYTTAKISKYTNEMLTMMFGDYMKLPDIQERGKHHEKIVYYEPGVPFSNLKGSESVINYFYGDGENPLEILGENK